LQIFSLNQKQIKLVCVIVLSIKTSLKEVNKTIQAHKTVNILEK